MMKRGQAAAGAAVLLAVIAGLLVMFVILIPPTERASLLGEPSTSSSSSSSGRTTAVANLLRESPGRIDYLGDDTIVHPLPVINIYTRTESDIIAEKNLAYAKRAAFTKENARFTFDIPDLENTDDVYLSFSVRSIEGRLKITLNGEDIFLGEKNDPIVEPILISKSSLLAQNEVLFSISSPGIAFWATNEVTIEDIKIIGDVTLKDAQTAEHTILISESEKANLDKATLTFQPECRFDEVRKLSITFNDRQIYNAIPDCDLALVKIELSPDALVAGENQLVFTAEHGTYLLSHVDVKSELKALEFPTYYFEVKFAQYQEVRNQTKRLRLQMDFVDTTPKEGEFIFNGHKREFDTRAATFVQDISADIVEGTNALKIKPSRTIEIRELRVDVVK